MSAPVSTSNALESLPLLYFNHEYIEAGNRLKKIWASAQPNPSDDVRAAVIYHMIVMGQFKAKEALCSGGQNA
jgi:hypothetical protein